MTDISFPLRIGTRGSPLALAQAHEVRARLMDAHRLEAEAFEIRVIKTTGDAVQDRPLSQIGGKGLFTREIEEQLSAGEIDMAVHSMKDMPVLQPEGLIIDCLLPREDVRDCLIGADLTGLDDLKWGDVVGTSSLRRRAQLLARRPDLRVVEFRGNVQTRLKKLADGVARCTFLAQAGLNRLGLTDIGAHAVAPEEMLPAIAQGAIGIERRADDARIAAVLAPLHDLETGTRVTAERAYLARLDGSCETPIAGLALIEQGQIWLRGEILRPDGSDVIAADREGRLADAAALGVSLADELLRRGGPDFFDWRQP